MQQIFRFTIFDVKLSANAATISVKTSRSECGAAFESFALRDSDFCNVFACLTLSGSLSPCPYETTWIRRCQIDARLDASSVAALRRMEAPLVFPTQIASNEEFIPPPQSLEQRKVEARRLQLDASSTSTR